MSVLPGRVARGADPNSARASAIRETTGFTVNPKRGSQNSHSIMKALNDAVGTVSGIDGNDRVYCASGSNVTIEGTGGTVVPASGSTGSVKNTNPAGGANITIEFPGSGSVQVPPGVTITFQG